MAAILRTERQNIIQWLYNRLSAGPVPINDLKEMARKDHISISSLGHAARELPCVSEHIGMRRRAWRLPTAAERDEIRAKQQAKDKS